MCTNKGPTAHDPPVGIPNGTAIHPTRWALLQFPELSLAAFQDHVFPSLQNKALLFIGQFYDGGFRVLFDKYSINFFEGYTSVLSTRYPTNFLYYIALPTPSSPVQSEAHSAYDIMTKTGLVQFLHRAAFSPFVLTCTKAINAGYFTMWLGLTSKLVHKHLLKSLATAKGYLKQTKKHFRSKKIVTPPPSTASA